MANNRGFALAAIRIKDTEHVTEEKFHRHYREELIPFIIEQPSPLTPKAALRYQSIDPNSVRPYFTFYPVSNVFVLRSTLIKTITGTIRARPSPVLDGQAPQDVIDFDIRPYRLLKTYRNPRLPEEEAEPSVCLGDQPGIVVLDVLNDAMGVQQRAGMKDDFAKDYTICKCITEQRDIWQRTTTYKRMDAKSPKYLAVHEFDILANDLSEGILKCGHECHEREAFQLLEAQGVFQ